MAVPWIQNAVVLGEMAPGLFGRTDLARNHVAASTMRNMFVNYRGGGSSRAGTAFVGFSKQTGRSFPPRLIPFQFNINQGRTLEFGDGYMRVIRAGEFVTDFSVTITDITNANPAVVTNSGASGGSSATPDNSNTVAPYAPGDLITIAGGTFTTPMQIEVDSTTILSINIDAPGSGYVQGDTITLLGGTQVIQPEVEVVTTRVGSIPGIAAAGAGGVDGTAIVTGTTGTGTPFQAEVTITGGAIVSVDALVVAGDYTINPPSLTNEPVTGAGLAGAQLSIVMGVSTVNVTTGGTLTANPVGLLFTQDTTSGTGTGATFKEALMGVAAASVAVAGVYSTFPPNPVSQASTTGAGLGVEFIVLTAPAVPFNNGDWVIIRLVGGMTEINDEQYVIQNVTPTTFELYDVYGNPINSTTFGAYSGGGVASRIFTLTTPWQEEDLKYLKFTQSADVMSICCVNQETRVEYEPYDLSRLADNNWQLTAISTGPTIAQPDLPHQISFEPSTPADTQYRYYVTSVAPDGSESYAVSMAVGGAVNLSTTQGSVTVRWGQVPGAVQYNVYKCSPVVIAQVPTGAPAGFVGFSQGNTWTDTNIIPDFTRTIPLQNRPFARGQVATALVVAGGSGYTNVTLGVISGTATIQAVLEPVIIGGALVGVIILGAGAGYAPTDTVVSVVGDGVGAQVVVTIGPQSGTYPSVPAYFQQRRFYANTLNNPDTYWLSQPAAFLNFDTRATPIDSDSIEGNPWAQQVDGIQFVVPMPGGLITMTGQAAWQVGGEGGSSWQPVPITPSSQQALQQAFNGISPTIPPVTIDNNIVYAQSQGSIVRNLEFSYNSNIYTGTDLTLNSSHLFERYLLREMAWCEEPFKVMWVVRNDGILLSMTFVKPQEVLGWARHDTQGLFRSVASIKETAVGALYTAVNRFVDGRDAYMIERMDDRNWNNVEDAWCVDAGKRLAQPTPNATLRCSSPTGVGEISGYSDLIGGSGYGSATTAVVIDDNGQGPGTGAVISLTIAGGVITALTIDNPGSGYVRPALVIYDPSREGTGASASLTLDNSAVLTASSPVFGPSNVGDVVRMGRGIMTVVEFLTTTTVRVEISVPITKLVPNTQTVQRAEPGEWSMTTPVTEISGGKYLAGATVTGLYDGKVIPPQVMPANGVLQLPEPATSVVMGLGFGVQAQTVYVDGGQPTMQGRRKKVAAVTARVQDTAAFKIGSNQVDGSTLSPMVVDVEWSNLSDAPTHALRAYNSGTTPLYTGDVRIPVQGGYQVPGQAAIEQLLPLPLNILAFIPEVLEGDEPEKTEGKVEVGA